MMRPKGPFAQLNYLSVPTGSSGDQTKRRRWWMAAMVSGLMGWLALGTATSVMAQAQPVVPELSRVVNLSASSFTEVPQDWLTLTLNTTREAGDPASVQNELKVAIESALRVVREIEQGDALQVRTGQFGLHPRYGTQGRIVGWRGTTELVLEGRDFERITRAAGRVQSLTMAQVSFSLSRQARQRLESDVQAQAIERFRARAADVTRAFGYRDFELREVSINSADEGQPMMRAPVMAMEMGAAASDAPVPVQPGKTSVSITVSGSIQMR